MPSNEEHAQHSYKRYGIYARDLHSWLDEPHELYGASHRWVRHQPEDVRNPPKWAVEKYGLERTRDIMMDHILFDKERSNNSYSRQTPNEPNPSEERYEEELSEEALKGLEEGLRGFEEGLKMLRGMKQGRITKENGTTVVMSTTTGDKIGFSFSVNVGQSPPNRKRKWVKSGVKEVEET